VTAGVAEGAGSDGFAAGHHRADHQVLLVDAVIEVAGEQARQPGVDRLFAVAQHRQYPHIAMVGPLDEKLRFVCHQADAILAHEIEHRFARRCGRDSRRRRRRHSWCGARVGCG
jgi:hypothetical protein